MMGDDDDLVLEPIDDEDEVSEEQHDSALLENLFGVMEVDDRIVMRRRPGARLERDAALNLAAWIVAETGVELHEFEDLVRSAVEGG